MSFIFNLPPAVHEDLNICHLLSLSMTESLSRHITVWFKDRLHKAQRDAALRVKDVKRKKKNHDSLHSPFDSSELETLAYFCKL